MKREIKFRAWDENKMIYDGDRIYPSFFTRELKDVCSPVLVSNRDVTFWVHESKLKHSDITYFDHISYLPIKAIMQFTGLKDKNRKEIYSDDILSDGINKFRVYAMYGGFSIKAPHWSDDMSEIGVGDDLIMQPLSDAQTMSYIAQSTEVIGNIWQNPELINK